MDRSIMIRQVDETTAAWLDKEATRRGQSVEAVALDLLRRGIEQAQLPTYHDLDALAGTWSDQETAEFLKAIARLNEVDEELWPPEAC